MKLTFTRKEFKSWLESKKPNAQVGIPENGLECPLANYLKEINKKDKNFFFVEVGKNDIKVYLRNETVRCSGVAQWMVNFMWKVDKYEENEKPLKRISAKKALQLLA